MKLYHLVDRNLTTFETWPINKHCKKLINLPNPLYRQISRNIKNQSKPENGKEQKYILMNQNIDIDKTTENLVRVKLKIELNHLKHEPTGHEPFWSSNISFHTNKQQQN